MLSLMFKLNDYMHTSVSVKLMHIVKLYLDIKQGKVASDFQPRVFIFGARQHLVITMQKPSLSALMKLQTW